MFHQQILHYPPSGTHTTYTGGSSTDEYHRETYGPDVEHLDFAREWRAENRAPDAWAAFFDDVGRTLSD